MKFLTIKDQEHIQVYFKWVAMDSKALLYLESIGCILKSDLIVFLNVNVYSVDVMSLQLIKL